MTLHTPVVISDGNAEVEALAASRGWRVLRPVGDAPALAGALGEVALPAERMDILGGDLEPARASRWSGALTFVREWAHRPLLVVDPDGPLADLALWANAALGWPTAAWLAHEPQSVTGAALLRAAVGAVRLGGADIPGPGELDAEPLVDLPLPGAVTTAQRVPDVARVLLVAADPDAFGGRVARWAEALGREPGLAVDVATARRDWTGERVHHVPDLGAAGVSEPGGALPGWGRALIAQVARRAPEHQARAFWPHALERHFAARHDDFDVVVMSGAPCPGEFARFAKRRWYAATVLDCPDPWTGDPLAADLERGRLLMADVITVPDEATAARLPRLDPDGGPSVLASDDVPGLAALVRRLGDHSSALPGG